MPFAELRKELAAAKASFEGLVRLGVVYYPVQANLGAIQSVWRSAFDAPLVGASTAGGAFTERGLTETGIVVGIFGGPEVGIGIAEGVKAAPIPTLTRAIRTACAAQPRAKRGPRPHRSLRVQRRRRGHGPPQRAAGAHARLRRCGRGQRPLRRRQAPLRSQIASSLPQANGVLVFDCGGRKARLAADFDEEVGALAGGSSVPMLGITGYGEIAKYGGNVHGFHNITAVMAAF